MALAFNANEVLQIAEQIERNGATFYRRAADYVSDASSKAFLERLADMEAAHEKTFSEMRGSLLAGHRASTAFDPEGEAAKYLAALADRRVFDMTADATSKLKTGITTDEILQIAIGAEKDSIVFYLGVKEVVPESLGRDRIDAIIAEEMGHITALTRELSAVEGG